MEVLFLDGFVNDRAWKRRRRKRSKVRKKSLEGMEKGNNRTSRGNQGEKLFLVKGSESWWMKGADLAVESKSENSEKHESGDGKETNAAFGIN